MGDFDFSSQYVQGNQGADRSVGGQDVPYNSVFTPNLGILTSGNMTSSTAGNVVTIAGVDSTGTILSTVSGWQGTDAKAAWFGTVPSIAQVSAWQGTDANYATIASWGGTYAKSGTTPDYATISTWMGTTGAASNSRTLIATGTASNSAYIEFKGADIVNYRRLYLTGEGVTPQTAYQSLMATTSSNAGGTYWEAGQYESNGHVMVSSYIIARYSTGWALINAPYVNINSYGGNFEATINRVAIGTSSPSIIAKGQSFYNTYSGENGNVGIMLPIASIDAIKIAYISGNINQGVFHLYGEH